MGQIDISFRAGDPGFSSLGQGWAEPESHHVWALGERSTLVLPALAALPGGYDVLMSVGQPPGERVQVLRLAFNSVDLGAHRIEGGAPVRAQIGAGDVHHGLNVLEIVPLFCVSPQSLGLNNDSRELSFSLGSMTIVPRPEDGGDDGPAGGAIDDAALLGGFESLGDDCEFGFVQRSVGIEPLSLLRFGGLRLHRLYEALGNGFDGIDAADELGVAIQGGEGHGEYMIVQNRYRYSYHTFVNSWEMDRDALVAREALRLAFCRRKLLEDLEDGEKIFVVKSSLAPGLRLDQVVPVAERVAGYGGGVTFWATAADAENPPGSVRWHGPTLVEGRLDRLCLPGEAAGLLSPLWVGLCRKVHREVMARTGRI